MERTDIGTATASRLLYLLVLSRPRFWLYLAGPVVVGVIYAATTPAELFGPAAIGLAAYFLLPANVLLYGVNDIYDADVDKVNPKKKNETNGKTVDEANRETVTEANPETVKEANPETVKEANPETVTEANPETVKEANPETVTEANPETVTEANPETVTEANPETEGKEARWQGDPVIAAAIGVAGALGIGTFLVTPAVAWPYLLGFFVLGVGYSAPPLRFKTTPLVDSISNGLYILPGAAAYAAVAGVHPPAFALVGAWLWTMAMHTFSAIPDIEPDRAAGIRTTATWLGESRTYAYCFGCWAAAAASFAVVDVRFLPVFGIYPLFVAWVARGDVAVDRAYWWFPALNTVVGAALSIAGLWLIVPITEVV